MNSAEGNGAGADGRDTSGDTRRASAEDGGSGSASKHVQFNSGQMSPRPISRKPTPFNQDLTAEIRRSGLDAVFPDEDGKAVMAAAEAAAAGEQAVGGDGADADRLQALEAAIGGGRGEENGGGRSETDPSAVLPEGR